MEDPDRELLREDISLSEDHTDEVEKDDTQHSIDFVIINDVTNEKPSHLSYHKNKSQQSYDNFTRMKINKAYFLNLFNHYPELIDLRMKDILFSSSILNGIEQSLTKIKMGSKGSKWSELFCICPTYYKTTQWSPDVMVQRDIQISITGSSYKTADLKLVAIGELFEEVGIAPQLLQYLIHVPDSDMGVDFFIHGTKKHPDRRVYNFVVDIGNCVTYCNANSAIVNNLDQISYLPQDKSEKVQTVLFGTYDQIRSIIRNIGERRLADDNESIRGFHVIKLTDVEMLLNLNKSKLC
jgi:hypothetical protein